MKKVISVAAVVLLVLVVAVTAFLMLQKPKPETVFHDYLLKQTASKTFGANEVYTATGADGSAKGKLDTSKKLTLTNATIKCTGNLDDNVVSLSSDVQLENASVFIKLNSISGQINDQNGNKVNLTTWYSKVVGSWYKSDDDPVTQLEIDSGVYVYNDGVIAPSYDSNKVVKAFEDNGVFKIDSSSIVDGKYVIKVTATKSSYLDALKAAFPNLSKPDLILDNLFGDSATMTFTGIYSKDGTLTSEKLEDKNLCTEMFTTFVGKVPTDLPKDISGTSTPESDINNIMITPITSSKPVADMAKDITQ